MRSSSRLGFAIASGTLKGVFGQGVLTALERHGIRPAVVGCASSSVISGCLFAYGLSASHGLDYWKAAAAQSVRDGMSKVVKDSIRQYAPLFTPHLQAPGSPRMQVAVSQVITAEAAAVTQGPGAKALGRRLLIELMRGNTSWVESNLKKTMFDTAASTPNQLHADNFEEVVYASTRMLHAWEEPAYIAGLPYVDASYTCSCPVDDVAATGAEKIIVISAEPGSVYRSLAPTSVVEPRSTGKPEIVVVQPRQNLTTIGVDYLKATSEGMERAFGWGYEAGEQLAKTLG